MHVVISQDYLSFKPTDLSLNDSEQLTLSIFVDLNTREIEKLIEYTSLGRTIAYEIHSPNSADED